MKKSKEKTMLNLFYSRLKFWDETVHLLSNEIGLVMLDFNQKEDLFLKKAALAYPDSNIIYCDEHNSIYAGQLTEYFQGSRKSFTFPVYLEGTDFRLKVWNALMEIPYGTVTSYKSIAEKIGSSKAQRAVGLANNKNKLPVIIPCHRVIGARGKLTGYGGGLHIKEKLLKLEGLSIIGEKVVG